MRILTMLVRHGTDAYQSAVEDVSTLFARQMPSVEWDLLVIDNSLPEDYKEEIGSNHTLIGGSNAQREFSSWDSGVKHLGDGLLNYDLINLATADFRELNPFYLNRVNAETLQLAFSTDSFANFGRNFVERYVVGHIDYYNDLIPVFGKPFQAWLKSSFLFLVPDDVKTLGSLVSIADPAAVFTGDPAAPFRIEAPLPDNYKQHMLKTIAGSYISAETLPSFQNKVLQILNEQLLSVRLRAQGCAMLDGSWLSTRAESLLLTNDPLGFVPRWISQVTTAGIRLPFCENSTAA
jgi:hypothetical protein